MMNVLSQTPRQIQLNSSRGRSLLVATMLLCCSLGGCASGSGDRADSAAARDADQIALLKSYMTGSFASTQQSIDDPEFFDVRLHITPIWASRNDGPWLYVEQAMATTLDAPYRQRVYRLSKATDGSLRSEVYTFPDAAMPKVVGAWKSAEPMGDMTPADLVLKDGCAVILNYSTSDQTFTGGTLPNACESSLRGAKFANSSVTVGPTMLVSWDQGFDAEGKQVWGAKKGGYRFVKATTPETSAKN